MNKVLITGTIFKDMMFYPKTEERKNAFIRFTVQTKDYYDAKDKKQYYSYVPCQATGKTAEFIDKYFKAGQAIVISDARMRNNNWDDNGTMQYDLVVVIREVEFSPKDFISHKDEKEEPILYITSDDLPF